MNIVKKLTFAYLKANKKKTIATVIGITLSTTLLFSVALIASTMSKNSINQAAHYSGTNHAEFTDIDYNYLETLKNNPDIKEIITEQIITNHKFSDCEDEFYTACSIDIIKLNIDYNDYLTISKGRLPKAVNEIVISKEAAKESKYEINDKIEQFIIVGIFSESSFRHDHKQNNMDKNGRETFNAYTDNDIDRQKPVNFYVKYASLRNIYSKIDNTATSLGLSSTINDNNIKEYSNTLVNTYLLQVHNKYQSLDPGLMLIILWVCFIFVILSIFCIFVIYNAFNISLSEKKKHMGILRSIGASRKHLFNAILYEAKILSIFCIPLGVVISFGLVQTVLLVLNRMLENTLVKDLQIWVNPIYAFISLFFVIVTIMYSARISAKEAGKTSPVEIVRQTGDIFAKDIKEHKIVRKFFGIPGELAYKNIKRNKSKYKVTVVSLCISVILFITFSAYTNYLVVNWDINLKLDYDIRITIPENDNKNELINEILSIKEIDESIRHTYFWPNYKALDKNKYTENIKKTDTDIIKNNFSYLTVYGLEEADYKEFTKKLNMNDKTKIIFYNQIIYNDPNNWAKKDKEIKVFKDENIKLELCDVEWISGDDNKANYKEKECYLTLENFYFAEITPFKNKNKQTPHIIVDMDKYNELLNLYYSHNSSGNKFDLTYLDINSKKFKQFDTSMKDITTKFSNVEFYYENDKLTNNNYYMQIQAIKLVLYSIVGFITLVGITSVFNTINTNMNLRKREFSMLRSIGLSRVNFNKMIRFESIFLGLKTLLYGIPISLALFWLWVFLYYVMTKEFIVLFPTIYFIISILGIILIIFVVMWYSSRKIKSNNIIDTIRNENI